MSWLQGDFLNILKSWIVLASGDHFGVCTRIMEDPASESPPTPTPAMDMCTLTQTCASYPPFSPFLILSAWQMKEFSGAFDTI